MKGNILAIFLILVSWNNYSQTTNNVNKHLLKGNLLFTPSLSYEFGIHKSSTVKLEIGTSLTIFEKFNKTSVGFFPKVETQYKYYYNLKKRHNKGKNTQNNSANFIAMLGIFHDEKNIIGQDDRVSDVILIGPAWGIQRSYKGGLSLLVEIGFGYDFGYEEINDTNGRPFPIIGFELGWVIFKK